MYMIYRDDAFEDLGPVLAVIDRNGINVVDGVAYFTTDDGVEYSTPVYCIEYIGTEHP